MRKSILYAPRVQGDLELALEPSRVTGPAGNVVKDWARIDSPGEHIPGRPTQEVWEETDDATPNYRIGTRRVQDERTFHYCKANTTYGISRSYKGAQNYNRYNQAGTQECWQGTLSVEALLNTYQLTTLDTTATHVADFFAGGWVYVRPASAAYQLYRIRSSTASGDDPSGSVTLTLWDPLVYTVASGSVIMIVPSIYSNVARIHGGGPGEAPMVCVPIIGPITGGEYFWGQTWGPCLGTLSEGDLTGIEEKLLEFVYTGDVRLKLQLASEHYEQLAGYHLMWCTQAQANGLCLYMLMLAP